MEDAQMRDVFAMIALYKIMGASTKATSKEVAYAAYEQAARMMDARKDFTGEIA
jgi:hypothetical protein